MEKLARQGEASCSVYVTEQVHYTIGPLSSVYKTGEGKRIRTKCTNVPGKQVLGTRRALEKKPG